MALSPIGTGQINEVTLLEAITRTDLLCINDRNIEHGARIEIGLGVYEVALCVQISLCVDPAPQTGHMRKELSLRDA